MNTLYILASQNKNGLLLLSFIIYLYIWCITNLTIYVIPLHYWKSSTFLWPLMSVRWSIGWSKVTHTSVLLSERLPSLCRSHISDYRIIRLVFWCLSPVVLHLIRTRIHIYVVADRRFFTVLFLNKYCTIVHT